MEDRDSLISGLSESARPDRTIDALNRAIAERDEQIKSVSDALAERERRIASLNRALALRDGKINRLNQMLDAGREQNAAAEVERVSQIAQLVRTVAEQEVQIAGLVQTTVARESQIADRDRAVAELENQIRSHQQRIQALLDSFSWRSTGFLRNVKDFVRSGIRRFFAALPGNPAVPVPSQAQSIRRIHEGAVVDGRFDLLGNPDAEAAGFAPAVASVADLAAAAENSPPAPVQQDAADEVVGQSPSTEDAQASSENARIDAEIEAIAKSGLFDPEYYRAMYPDLPPEPADPFRHYCEHGWREGKNPSDDFDTRGYLRTNGDVEDADVNPLWHYVVAGASEGRRAMQDSVVRVEDELRFRNISSDVQLVAWYATPDWEKVGRALNGGAAQPVPHPDLGRYRTSDPEVLIRQALLARRHGLSGWCFSLTLADGMTDGSALSTFLACPGIRIAFCLDLDLRVTGLDPTSSHCVEVASSDDRYLKIDGRPVWIVTLPDEVDDRADALRTLDALSAPHQRRPFRIVRFHSVVGRAHFAAAPCDCDAVLDLPAEPIPGETGAFRPSWKNASDCVPYSVIASQGIARIARDESTSVPVYRAVTVSRDHSPIDATRPLRYTRFDSRQYRGWLDAAIADSRKTHAPEKRLLFLNAWNDWNHGMVLEPDHASGYGKLNETSRALLGLASENHTPLVTVVVPNYNHAHYLRRRLETVYRQTYQNFEVLLLDDCSTDDSRTVLSEYHNRYPHFTQTIFNEINSGGVFRQWAKGIKAASGDLIWIAESDDYCAEDFLEQLVRFFADEAVMLAYSKIEFVNADESIMTNAYSHFVRDLDCPGKWMTSYVNTAHQEVSEALGIINTVPNASGAVFRRPLDMPLLEDEVWLSMAVVGDWVFYLHLIRGGKIAYSPHTLNYFRKYDGSTAAGTYHKERFYRELGMAAQTVQRLYDAREDLIWRCRQRSKEVYDQYCGSSDDEFMRWFNEIAVFEARAERTPNVLIVTMDLHADTTEILPIRIANELKRRGHSILMLSLGSNGRKDGVRRMLRSDIPVVETADAAATKGFIHDFGIEILGSYHWPVQNLPNVVADVFFELKAHVASLHGMLDPAFRVTSEQLRVANENVATWVYCTDEDLRPFIEHGLYDSASHRFTKVADQPELRSDELVAQYLEIFRTALPAPAEA